MAQTLFLGNPTQANFIAAPTSIQSKLLAANVPEIVTPPTGASKVLFKSTADFYVWYRNNDLQAADSTTNGSFGADTDWTKGSGWTISAGVADAAGATNGDLEQTPTGTKAIVSGQAYYVTFTATRSLGSVTPVIGGTSGTARSSSATFSEIIVAGSGGKILFDASGFTGTIDNVSVIPCAVVPGDNSTGYSSELNPDRRHIGAVVTDFSIVSASTPIVTMCFYGD